MFFGVVVKPSQPYKFVADPDREILHVSQISLNAPSHEGKNYFRIRESPDKPFYTICCLQKDTCEHASVDLFVNATDGLSFSVNGTNEIHVVGYFEPEGPLDDASDLDNEEIDDVPQLVNGKKSDRVTELTDGADGMKKKGALEVAGKQAKTTVTEKTKPKTTAAKIPDSDGDDAHFSDDDADDDDDDNEFDDDDGDDDDDDDDDDLLGEDDDDSEDDAEGDEGDMGSDEEDEDDDSPALDKAVNDKKGDIKAKNAKTAQKRKADVTVQKGDSKKPKAAVTAGGPTKGAQTPPKVQNKVQKAKGGTAAASGANANYMKAIKDYIAKNGRTNLGVLGSKVKRPDGVATKLGLLLKEHANEFKMENGFVSLK